MDFIIVGAGAVGAVVGALLHQDGHRVRFWVRPAHRARLGRLSVERIGGPSAAIDAPECLSPGDPAGEPDWVLVCVRGEQLDAALLDVVEHLGADRRVAIAAVSLQPVTEQARRVGLTGEVYALHASFGSFATAEEPPSYRWYPFALPTTVTPDGERARLGEARTLSRALARAGLPARSRLTMTAAMRLLVALNTVLALGWDLCDWDLPRLVKTPALRRQTAAAMHESLAVAAPERSPLRWLPRVAFDWFLRCLPLFMGSKAREVWRHHGPKIRAQTDHVTRELLAEAEARKQPAPVLGELFEQWQALAPHRAQPQPGGLPAR